MQVNDIFNFSKSNFITEDVVKYLYTLSENVIVK